mgnify:CR=1 FL=1
MLDEKSRVLVSVIITCYNLEKYISRAINSCINQTLSDDRYEIIVVDDCRVKHPVAVTDVILFFPKEDLLLLPIIPPLVALTETTLLIRTFFAQCQRS